MLKYCNDKINENSRNTMYALENVCGVQGGKVKGEEIFGSRELGETSQIGKVEMSEERM